MKETLELIEGSTNGFDLMEEQLREFVLDSLSANTEKMNELVNSTTEKLGITKLTVAMAEVESFVELGPTKDKFKSSKPNGKGNGEINHEEYEEGHNNDGNSTDSTIGNGKPRDAK
ncbi:hypothetical protein Golob_027520 [Gossypium lobatum]|uniref:Uncharacterized protein n=2 Tax=Gossypium lobatum TaxID=34289 RepID=A0A7J8NI50_9ROSI|nr:hypothetical protein [Gossypium lobatum]